MTTALARAETRGRANACLARYRPELQSAARALAERHIRLAELSASFPALFVALARPRARFDPEPVIANVIAGAPLAALADAARVPLWLRKMPPKMFSGPIPELPDGLYLRRRIANHLPVRAKGAHDWLEMVSRSANLAHEPFALWCAQLAERDRRKARGRLERLALWAWFSTEPATRAHGFITRRWSPEMELKAAFAAAEDWYQTVYLYAYLGDWTIRDVDLNPGNVGGFDIRPLRSAEEIVAEARAMKNCVRTYGPELKRGTERLWSVQRRGRRVATLCVAWRCGDPLPLVAELKLSRNRKAPPELWLIARKWLNGQDLLQLNRWKKPWPPTYLDRDMWRELWKPYWMAKRRFPEWLPLRPSIDALDDL
jgi:hypothetical protein